MINDDRLEKLKIYKTIQLTEEEKNTLRSYAAHTIATAPQGHTESFLYKGLQHGLRIALSTFLFIVFIGSSVSVVADSALPGDPLYLVKTDINEKLRGVFVETSEEKVVLQKRLIEKRADEIQTLAETKTLTKAKQETLNRALDNHVKELSKELTTLSDEAPSTALTVTASLEQNLLAAKQAIQKSSTDTTDPDVAGALKAVDGTLKIVSEQEVKIISKEIDNIANAVETVPNTSISDFDDDTTTGTESTPVVLPSTTSSTPSVTPSQP